DMPLSRVLLMRDANYPWLLLVPRRPNAVEIIDLDDPTQSQLLREIGGVARALKTGTACEKLNIAAHRKTVAQRHEPIAARFPHHGAWPRPVWGSLPPREYDPTERERLAAALRRQLELPSSRS